MKKKIEICCYKGLEEDYANSVVKQHGSILMEGIELQAEAGNAKQVYLEFDDLFISAGDREYGLKEGINLAEDTEYCALVMPCDSELAEQYRAAFNSRPGSIRIELDKLETNPGYC